ncbi:MAG: segregation/condensation protein A [Chloroflexota bacterium]|nr:segregation/condensation protein A [Chloroflexota bacterium]
MGAVSESESHDPGTMITDADSQPQASEAADAPTDDAGSVEQTANGAFQVRLEVFEGPLDLLLKLIERRQLDISKVALSEVTDAFLSYMSAHPDMPPAPMASFVWVASKLLWIKSQMLLPRMPATRTEDDEEDPGDELIRRLEAYKRVQEAAKWLRCRELAGLRSYERPASLEPQPVAPKPKFSPEETGTGLEGVTLTKLVKMVQKRMQLGMPAIPTGTATRGHTITVAEKVVHLRKRLSPLKKEERLALGIEFAEASMRSRTELVVLFLAVLEIIRRKMGVAEQDEAFGEIWLRKAE